MSLNFGEIFATNGDKRAYFIYDPYTENWDDFVGKIWRKLIFISHTGQEAMAMMLYSYKRDILRLP